MSTDAVASHSITTNIIDLKELVAGRTYLNGNVEIENILIWQLLLLRTFLKKIRCALQEELLQEFPVSQWWDSVP